MSCRVCGPVNPCIVPGDFDASGRVYLTQDLIFLVNCPTGYLSLPGSCPRLITIRKSRIDPIVVPPGSPTVLRMQACDGVWVVRVVPAGATDALKLALAIEILTEVANRQAICDFTQGDGEDPNDGSPPIPPPPLRTGVAVGNDQQCDTVDCAEAGFAGESGTPVTQCVPANTFTEWVANSADAAGIAAAKARLNQTALDQAHNLSAEQIICSPCDAAHPPFNPDGSSAFPVHLSQLRWTQTDATNPNAFYSGQPFGGSGQIGITQGRWTNFDPRWGVADHPAVSEFVTRLWNCGPPYTVRLDGIISWFVEVYDNSQGTVVFDIPLQGPVGVVGPAIVAPKVGTTTFTKNLPIPGGLPNNPSFFNINVLLQIFHDQASYKTPCNFMADGPCSKLFAGASLSFTLTEV